MSTYYKKVLRKCISTPVTLNGIHSLMEPHLHVMYISIPLILYLAFKIVPWGRFIPLWETSILTKDYSLLCENFPNKVASSGEFGTF